MGVGALIAESLVTKYQTLQALQVGYSRIQRVVGVFVKVQGATPSLEQIDVCCGQTAYMHDIHTYIRT